MKRLAQVLTASSLLLFAETAISDAKVDAEILMNSALPSAEKMLSEHGEFYPFGEAMKPDGQIVSVGAAGESDQPPSQELIDILKVTFREAAAAGEYKATAVVFDILTIPPGETEKVDAIAIALDHVDNYSVVVIFPYSIDGKSVTLYAPFGQKGDGDIF